MDSGTYHTISQTAKITKQDPTGSLRTKGRLRVKVGECSLYGSWVRHSKRQDLLTRKMGMHRQLGAIRMLSDEQVAEKRRWTLKV